MIYQQTQEDIDAQEEANPTQAISAYDFLNKRAAKKGGELTAQEYNDAVETYTQNYRNLAVRNFLGEKYTKEQQSYAEQNWDNAAAAFKRMPVDDTSDKALNIGKSFLGGALGSVSDIVKVADTNIVTDYLDNASQELVNSKTNDSKIIASRNQAARDKASEEGGFFNIVKTAIETTTLEDVASGAGSIAPTALAALATGGTSASAQVAARVLPSVIGAAQGVGGLKSGINAKVYQDAIKAGKTEAEAKQMANSADDYSEIPFYQTAGAGVLGAASGVFGAEANLANKALLKTGTSNVLKRVAVSGLEEVAEEAAQTAQSSIAANQASIAKGLSDKGLFSGVLMDVAQATILGGAVGGGFGIKKNNDIRLGDVQNTIDAQTDLDKKTKIEVQNIVKQKGVKELIDDATIEQGSDSNLKLARELAMTVDDAYDNKFTKVQEKKTEEKKPTNLDELIAKNDIPKSNQQVTEPVNTEQKVNEPVIDTTETVNNATSNNDAAVTDAAVNTESNNNEESTVDNTVQDNVNEKKGLFTDGILDNLGNEINQKLEENYNKNKTYGNIAKFNPRETGNKPRTEAINRAIDEITSEGYKVNNDTAQVWADEHWNSYLDYLDKTNQKSSANKDKFIEGTVDNILATEQLNFKKAYSKDDLSYTRANKRLDYLNSNESDWRSLSREDLGDRGTLTEYQYLNKKRNKVETKPASQIQSRVLQNRNRQSPQSIAQMTAIAAKPDFMRAGISNTMQDGAPVVFSDADELPSGTITGDNDTAVDGNGNRYNVQYAVMEGSQIITSNKADGTPVAEYNNGTPNTVRPVAGNGRAAGIKQGYTQGTASQYRSELEAKAERIGIDPAAIKGMKYPVLVRVMPNQQVRDDIGDLSNISQTAALSPVEQAKTDAARIDLDSIEFDENGVTTDSVTKWVSSLPQTEASSLTSDDKVSKQAISRLANAVFYKAYGSDELVKLYGESTDPEIVRVINAVGSAAPFMAQLEGTGDYDIREAVVEATQMAVNAKRKVEKLSDYLNTVSFTESGEGVAIALFFAENYSSGKAMREGLINLAQTAINASDLAKTNETQNSFFEPATPATRQQIFKGLENGKQANETTKRDEQRTGNVDNGSTKQKADDPVPKNATKKNEQKPVKVAAPVKETDLEKIKVISPQERDGAILLNRIKGKYKLFAKELKFKGASGLPGYSGNKLSFITKAGNYLKEMLNNSEHTTIYDAFGGGGGYGLWVAVNATKKVNTVVINEIDSIRSLKTQWILENNGRLAELYKTEKMIKLISILRKTSGTPIGTTLEKGLKEIPIGSEKNLNYPLWVEARDFIDKNPVTNIEMIALQAIKDRVYAARNPKVTIDAIIRLAIDDAVDYHKNYQKLIKRGGKVVFTVGDGTLPNILPENSIVILDPPYVYTEGYKDTGEQKDSVGSPEFFNKTKELLKRAVKNKNFVIYHNSIPGLTGVQIGDAYGTKVSNSKVKFDGVLNDLDEVYVFNRRGNGLDDFFGVKNGRFNESYGNNWNGDARNFFNRGRIANDEFARKGMVGEPTTESLRETGTEETLTQQTADEARQDIANKEATAKANAKEDARIEAERKAEQDAKEVKQAGATSADNFVLGGNPQDELSGQASILNSLPRTDVKKQKSNVSNLRKAIEGIFGNPGDTDTKLNKVFLHETFSDLPSGLQARLTADGQNNNVLKSVADIKKISYKFGEKNVSLEKFAEQFQSLIKQKDTNNLDVDRIANKVIQDVINNPSSFLPQATGETLGYKQYLTMMDGKEYDPLNIAHANASDLTVSIYQAKNDGTLQQRLSQEAKNLNDKRVQDLNAVANYLNGNTDYNVAEQAMILDGARKYAVVTKQNDSAVEVSLVSISSSNRASVPVIDGLTASLIADELRKGKNIKQAMRDGIQIMHNKKSEDKNTSKNGWVTYKKSDSEADAADLNKGCAGREWCTAGSVGTARSQLEGGDFHVYYEKGEPLVAIRTDNGEMAEPPRGSLPGQALTEKEDGIADDFLRNKSKVTGGEDYLEDRDFIKKIMSGDFTPEFAFENQFIKRKSPNGYNQKGFQFPISIYNTLKEKIKNANLKEKGYYVYMYNSYEKEEEIKERQNATYLIINSYTEGDWVGTARISGDYPNLKTLNVTNGNIKILTDDFDPYRNLFNAPLLNKVIGNLISATPSQLKNLKNLEEVTGTLDIVAFEETKFTLNLKKLGGILLSSFGKNPDDVFTIDAPNLESIDKKIIYPRNVFKAINLKKEAGEDYQGNRINPFKMTFEDMDLNMTFSKNESTAQAFYDPSTKEIHLIADRIEQGSEAAVFLHEVWHKQGLNLLGKENLKGLSDAVKEWKNQPATTVERQVYDAANRRAGLISEFGKDANLYDAEFLNYAIEEAKIMGVTPDIKAKKGSIANWFAQVFDAFNRALNKLINGMRIKNNNIDFNVQDLMAMAYGAAGLEYQGDIIRDARKAPRAENTSVEVRKNTGGYFSLAEIAQGFHSQPDDYFDTKVGARYYGYDDTAGRESQTAVNNLIKKQKAGKELSNITIYRAVPKNSLITRMRSGDWVSLSKTYATQHGISRFGKYSIIEQIVSPNDVWWDGNDINEFGYEENLPNNQLSYNEKGEHLAPNGKPSKLTEQQAKTVRTEAFKNWFGDWENDPESASKVIDENGEPLVVYHGTREKFNEFSDEFMGRNATSYGKGFYFTPDLELAKTFNSSNQMQVFLNIKKYLNLEKNTITKDDLNKIIDELPMIDYGRNYENLNNAQLKSNFINVLLKQENDIDVFDTILDAIQEKSYQKSKIKKPLLKNRSKLAELFKKIIVADGVKSNDNQIIVTLNSNQIKSAVGNTTFNNENNILFSKKETVKQKVEANLNLGNKFKASTERPSFTATEQILKEGKLQSTVPSVKEIGDKAVTLLSDSTRPHDTWALDNLTDDEALPLIRAKNLAAGREAAFNKEVIIEFGDKISMAINKIVSYGKLKNNKITFEAAHRLAGEWLSATYAPIANKRLLNADLAVKINAVKKLNELKDALKKSESDLFTEQVRFETDRLKEQIKEASELVNNAIKKYEIRKKAIENEQVIDPTKQDLEAPLAGGLNNASAKYLTSIIEKSIPKKLLEGVAQEVYAMNEWKMQKDIEMGKVTQEVADKFDKSGKYVPLTGDPLFDDSGMNSFESTKPNISRDRFLKGKIRSLAVDGISASFEQIQKTAKYHAWNDYKDALHNTYEVRFNYYKNQDKTDFEAQQAVFNDTGIKRDNNILTAPSNGNTIIYNKNGEFYSYDIGNIGAIEALRSTNVEDVPSAIRYLAQGTRIMSKLVTQLMFGFAPTNSFRDVWEKSENIRTRKYKNVDMNKVASDMLKISLAQAKSIHKDISPVVSKGTWLSGKFKIDPKNENQKLLMQLANDGGLSTFGDFISTDGVDLSKKLAGLNTKLSKSMDAIAVWNDSFEIVSSLSAYKALLQNGVPSKDAAEVVLELMNFRKGGTALKPIKALYMFAQPIATGGHQLIKTLSTPTGKKRFIGYMVAAMALYALLRAGQDDEELGINKMDELSNFQTERNIVIPTGDGTSINIPIGFGLPMLAWGYAVNLDKMILGRQTATETAAELTKLHIKTFAPVAPSETSISAQPMVWIGQTLTPSIFKPIGNILMDRTAFGAPLTSARFEKSDKANALEGKASTAELYKDIAKQMAEFGFDMYPEQVKEIIKGYGLGLISEVLKASIDNPAKEANGKQVANFMFDRVIKIQDKKELTDKLYYRIREQLNAVGVKSSLNIEMDAKETKMLKLLNDAKEKEAEMRGKKSAATKEYNKNKNKMQFDLKVKEIEAESNTFRKSIITKNSFLQATK